jgi:hypothetical protein
MRVGLSLSVVVLSLATATSTPSFAAERPVLRFLWADVQQRAEAIRPFVVAETEDLVGAAGVDVAWEDGGGVREILRGEIWIAVLSTPHPGRATVMGSIVPGRRAVWVFLPAVRSALGLRAEMPRLVAPSDARDIGRAVARVIVHELVHIGAPDHPHAGGLMESHLRRTVLTRDGVVLSPAMARALAAAAAPAARGDAPPTLAAAR